MSQRETTSVGTQSRVREPLRVLLLENVHESAGAMFSQDGFEVVRVSTALSEGELMQRLSDVHVLGIRSKTKVTRAALEVARQLLAVGCFCIGTNQVDLAAAKQRGVAVFNAPFSNTRSVAELVIAEIITLARQLGDRSRDAHSGVWRKTAAGAFEVRDKTLGIIGYGHIGRQVGVLAEALGMHVFFYDILTKLPMGNNRPCSTLSELLQRSDFLTLHVPATPETHDLIAEPQFAEMKRGAYLLNASRGSVVRLPALVAALRSKHLAGAAVDVFPEEPAANGGGFTSPLQNLPNVVLTPHIGGSTLEAQAAIGREVATSLLKYINTGGTTGSVNFPALERAQKPGTHRLLNVHRNVPGVLRDVNHIVFNRHANISSQLLATDTDIGYLIMDIDDDVASAVRDDIAALATNIRTRILQ